MKKKNLKRKKKKEKKKNFESEIFISSSLYYSSSSLNSFTYSGFIYLFIESEFENFNLAVGKRNSSRILLMESLIFFFCVKLYLKKNLFVFVLVFLATKQRANVGIVAWISIFWVYLPHLIG